MAKKVLKQSLYDYAKPVNGACVNCGHRIKSSQRVFCECGTALMSYRRSMRLTLMVSMSAAIVGIVFNMMILKFNWALIAPWIAAGTLIQVDAVYLRWQSTNHWTPEMSSLVLVGGWFLFGGGCAFF